MSKCIYIQLVLPATGARIVALWNDLCVLLNLRDLQRHRVRQEGVCYAPVRGASPVLNELLLARGAAFAAAGHAVGSAGSAR